MKLIGLTGGAGSGKTTVAAMLRELGATVVDADEAAHAVYAPGTPGFDAVVKEFGKGFVVDGHIDRASLGELVFSEPEARRRLNAIVHPLVREEMARRTAEAAERGARVVVHDIPLLFENGLQRIYETVVLVYSPASTQIARLVARGVPAALARAIVASQMPIDEKRAIAKNVIDNSGSLDETRRQVDRFWSEIEVGQRLDSDN